MKVKRTPRGFEFINFKDKNGVDCSLQQSSLATDECIWFGADKIGVKEFTAYGNPAWVDRTEFDIQTPPHHHFVANNRMHLTRKQVAKLLPILQNFVDTGYLTK